MPTYENRTERRVTFPDKNYLSWQPGESRALPFFVPHEALGLTQTSPEPFVLKENGRGFEYDEFIVVPGTPTIFHIPYARTVEISVFVLNGYVKMTVGDSDVPIVVDTSNNHASRYPWDMSAYLTFEAEDAETAVYVKCEPFTSKGE